MLYIIEKQTNWYLDKAKRINEVIVDIQTERRQYNNITFQRLIQIFKNSKRKDVAAAFEIIKRVVDSATQLINTINSIHENSRHN